MIRSKLPRTGVFLVTGDRYLLVLDGEIEQLRIVTAAEFLLLLDEQRAEP